MSLHRKGQLSRADLIEALLQFDQSSFDYLTSQLGLFKQPEIKEERAQVELSVQSTSQSVASHDVAPVEAGLKPGMGFWALHKREKTAQKTQVETVNKPMPLDWSMHSSPPPKHYPLASPRALLPRLLRHLKHQRNSREIDVAAIVRKMSRGEHLNRLPRNKRQSLGPHLHIIDDRHLHLTPYWFDHVLFSSLFENLLPDYASSRAVLRDGSPLPVSIDSANEISDWVLPPEGSVVIVFSDLGALSTQPHGQVDAWLDIARLLTQRDCKLIALIPCRPDECDARFKSIFILEPWEKALPGSQASAWEPVGAWERGARKAAAEKLLTLLSPAIRLEPSLLRCIRKKLVQKGIYMDAGVEAMVWQHPAMQEHSSVAATFNSEARKLWLEKFYQEEESLREMILDTLRSWRANLAPVWFEEIASLNEASRQGVPQADIQVAAHYFQKLIVQSESGLALTADADTQSWLGRMENRLPQEACNSQDVGPVLQEIIAQRHKNDESYHTQHALNPALLTPVNTQPKNAVLYQQGECIRLGSVSKADWIGHSPLASISYKRCLLYIEFDGLESSSSETGKGRSQSFLFQPDDQESRKICDLADIEGFMIRSDMESLYFKQMPKPGWATSIGRDQQGLFVTVPWLNEPRLYWQEKPRQWSDSWKGSWSESFSHWSGHESLGVDEYGLYADLDIKGIIQRFRWIAPGTFSMGSPEDEAGRFEREVQHKVTLTQGFWLADTAVTQALWQALMGNNPSDFKESGNHPVENVSWNDAQDFISNLNEIIPGINAQLPSEAEWEYACRAGAQGAFNFEGELNLDKVNYRGTWDYESGKWGEGALQKTVDVKNYACNAWGLYQMHGNVWEWCQDFWVERLPTEPVINPKGPDEGALRVVRGGSWIDSGRYARSAFRVWYVADDRLNYFGFRLAIGLELRSSQVRQAQSAALRVGDVEQRRPVVAPIATQSTKLERIKDKFKKLWKL